ncbi:MAG TPA: YafY family protein [Polyangiaceae bacterium]|nr:YafY family protein [Polyangiaceae bacterium]
MSRASRLLELMDLLRRRRAPISGTDLASALGISVRTLYRDIATLQAQGAEIQGEPGVGYVLQPGFTLPPLMFSAEELEALVLGSRWVAVRGDARLSAAAENAIAKIRAVLPRELRESVDEATLTVPSADAPPTASIDVSVVRAAVRQERKLVIGYQDGSGQVTRRVIWPILIGFFERVLVVAAWCELRQDYRGFRVDRIREVEETGTPYPGKRVALVRDWRERQGISR